VLLKYVKFLAKLKIDLVPIFWNKEVKLDQKILKNLFVDRANGIKNGK
jgi:hypothetical protein